MSDNIKFGKAPTEGYAEKRQTNRYKAQFFIVFFKVLIYNVLLYIYWGNMRLFTRTEKQTKPLKTEG